MNLRQFRKGHEHYQCKINIMYSADPIQISNHPSLLQQATIYDRKALKDCLDHNSVCPMTREPLVYGELRLTSVRQEVLLFTLAAEKFLSTASDAEKAEVSNEAIEVADHLKLMRKEHAALVVESEKILIDLANDNRVDLPIDVIGNLLSVGVEADFSKQKHYAEDRKNAEEHKIVAEAEAAARNLRAGEAQAAAAAAPVMPAYANFRIQEENIRNNIIENRNQLNFNNIEQLIIASLQKNDINIIEFLLKEYNIKDIYKKK